MICHIADVLSGGQRSKGGWAGGGPEVRALEGTVLNSWGSRGMSASLV